MLHATALAHLFGGQYGRAWKLCNGVPSLMTQHSIWRVTEGSCPMQTYLCLRSTGLAASVRSCSNGQIPLPPSHQWRKLCNLF